MSELSDLAEALTKDLPIAARRVIDKALECGWELNKPGMTVALRLNHPSDELAQPVYITWVVGRTGKGGISFRFDSCGTKGLVNLKPADLLEYLEDPTVIYPTDDDLEEVNKQLEDKARKKWDENAPDAINVKNRLNGEIIGFEGDKKSSKTQKPSGQKTFHQLMTEQKLRLNAESSTTQSGRPTQTGLRIKAPTVPNDPPWKE